MIYCSQLIAYLKACLNLPAGRQAQRTQSSVTQLTHLWLCIVQTLRPLRGTLRPLRLIDVKTRKILLTLQDEFNNSVASEKMLEIDFENGKAVKAGDQFGIGRVKR